MISFEDFPEETQYGFRKYLDQLHPVGIRNEQRPLEHGEIEITEQWKIVLPDNASTFLQRTALDFRDYFSIALEMHLEITTAPSTDAPVIRHWMPHAVLYSMQRKNKSGFPALMIAVVLWGYIIWKICCLCGKILILIRWIPCGKNHCFPPGSFIPVTKRPNLRNPICGKRHIMVLMPSYCTQTGKMILISQISLI